MGIRNHIDIESDILVCVKFFLVFFFSFFSCSCGKRAENEGAGNINNLTGTIS